MHCCSLIASAPNFSTHLCFWRQGLVNWQGRQGEHLVEDLLKEEYNDDNCEDCNRWIKIRMGMNF